MASYVPSELQAYGDLINPPSKSSTPTGDLVGIYQGIPVYANKPIDPVYTGSDQDGNAYFIDKNTGAPIHPDEDGSYHFNGNGGEDSGNGSQNLTGFDPSKLLSGATLGKVDWNYQSVRGGMGASGNNSTAINALWGGSSYPNGRVTDWAHIDSTQKQANFTAGQTRDALWNVYDNLSAQGKTPAKNPDEIALQLAADNGATNYNSAGYIAGYGAGANTLGLAETISAVFMNQPQVVSVTQHPYTVSPQSIADATTFGEAHSSPNVINTLNTFVKQGQNGPDYLGAALQAGALAVAGGALYAGALSGLGGATAAGLEAGTTVAATTAGIANTTLAAVGAGAAVGGISAAINGGDIIEGALKGAFASALGAVISPAAQELVKASNGAINLQVAQAAVQAAAVAAKAGLTGGDVTTAITNSLEGSAISAGMKDMNIPSNIAKIVTPIVVTGLNNGDVNAAIQNSLINYASGFGKSAISPSTTPSTPPAIASPAPDVGQPIATPLAEPPPALPAYNTDVTPTSSNLPTNLSTTAPSTSPIVSSPLEIANANTPSEAITTPANLPTAPEDQFNLAPGTTINEQGNIVATGIPTALDVPSNLDSSLLNKVPMSGLDTIDINAPGGFVNDPLPTAPAGGLPTTAPVAELTPEQLNRLHSTFAGGDATSGGVATDAGPIPISGLNTYSFYSDGGNNGTGAMTNVGSDRVDPSSPTGFRSNITEKPVNADGSPYEGDITGSDGTSYTSTDIGKSNGTATNGDVNPSGSPSGSGTTAGGGLPATEYNPLLDVPILPVNSASGSGGLPTNGSPTPPSNDSGSTNEPPSPNPPVNGSPTAPPVENAPPPSNGLPVENPPSKETPQSGNPTPNTPTGDVSPIPNKPTDNVSPATNPSTGTLNTAPVDAQGNQIENIKSGLTTLGDTVNANQNTTNTAIGDLSESTKVALANATAQEKSDFEKLNASQQASTIAATEQGVALSKAIEASQSNTESQIGNLSDTVASNQAKTNASLEGLSNEQKANFDAMTKAQQDAAIAQAGVNGSLSTSISNVQNGLDAQGNQIAGLTSTVSGLGTYVNGLGTQVGDVGATVGGLGATVSGLGTALDNLSTADKANFATLSDAQKQLAVDEAKATGDLSKAIADVASSTTSGLASIASSVSGLGNTVSANQAATTAANQATNANLNNLKAQQAEQLRSSQLLKADPFLTPNLIMNKKQAMKTEQPISPLNLQGPVAYNETTPIQFEKLQDYAPVSQDFYHGGPVHYADGSGDEPVAKEPTEEDMIALNAQIDAILNKKSSSERPVRVRQDESEMPIHSLIKHHLISSRVKADPLFHGLSAELSHLNAGVSPYTSQHYENRQLQGYEPIMRSSEIPGIHQAHGGYIDPKLLAILQKHFVPGPEGHLYQRHEERGFAVGGAGTGQSDDIPTMLSDGEYVVDADTVAALGDGSSKAGAQALDKMREAIRTHKRSAPADKIPPKAKSPLEYLKMSKGR